MNIITMHFKKYMDQAKSSRPALIFLMCICIIIIYPSISLGGAVGTLSVNMNTNPDNCNVISISTTAVLQSDNTAAVDLPPKAKNRCQVFTIDKIVGS
jgi:hypothetical protein